MKILVVVPKNYNGTIHHRIGIPMYALKEAGHEITHCEDLAFVSEEDLTAVDAVLVSTHVTTFPLLQPQTLVRLRRAKTKLILDIDDHWQMPLDHPSFEHWPKDRDWETW